MRDDLLMRLNTAVLYDVAGDESVLPELAAASIRELETQLAEARADGWRRGIEAAAREVDCACEIAQKQAVIATTSPNGGPRWMACGAVDCSALTAAAIRALPLPADLGVRHE